MVLSYMLEDPAVFARRSGGDPRACLSYGL